MTQTTPEPKPDLHPDPLGALSEILLHLIVVFLAPMFLPVTGGNIDFARLAALHAVNAYRARTDDDLLTVALIIGFGIAALDSLSLATGENLPLPMILRLRGNATSCNRAATLHRRALNQPRHQRPSGARFEAPATPPEPPPATNEAAIIAGVAAARQQAAAEAKAQVPHPSPDQPAAPDAAITDQQRQVMWAAAAADVAAEYTADLASLPPDARRAAMIRAEMLSRCAMSMLSSPPAPRPRPADLSGLMHPGQAVNAPPAR